MGCMYFVAIVPLVLLCAAAGRVPEDVKIVDDRHLVVSSLAAQAFPDLTRDEDHTRSFAVAFKYVLPPSASKDFVEIWLELEKKSRQEPGLQFLSLSKTVGDNVLYIAYGEWRCLRDWREHLETEYVKEFIEAVGSLHIVMSDVVLIDLSSGNKVRAKNQSSERYVHMLTRYFIDAGKVEGFKDQWEHVANLTSREKGNQVYNLAKRALDNIEFWCYGTWDTWEDYHDHIHSQYAQQLVSYMADHDIVWYSTPLRRVAGDVAK